MTEPHLELDGVSYFYEEGRPAAVDGFSFSLLRGEFVALLGHNGSGKSTVAKLANGLFLPSGGRVRVSGLDTADPARNWEVRKRAGMVFQNPDNQIVATVVREDVAFGLENIGVPTQEMPGRIERALRAVGMEAFADRAPHLLSGGQKQRVAIAGILAMEPEALILDEATAMLDPSGRREVFDTVRRLNRERGITVLWITHFMEEAALFDRVAIMYKGRLAADGSPREVFSRTEEVRSWRLDIPPMAGLAQMLAREGIPVRQDVLTVEEMAQEVERVWASGLKA